MPLNTHKQKIKICDLWDEWDYRQVFLSHNFQSSRIIFLQSFCYSLLKEVKRKFFASHMVFL